MSVREWPPSKRLKPEDTVLYVQDRYRPADPTPKICSDSVMPPLPYCTREWASRMRHHIKELEVSDRCNRAAAAIIGNMFRGDLEAVFSARFLEQPGIPDRLRPWLHWCVVYVFMTLCEPLAEMRLARKRIPVFQPVIKTIKALQGRGDLWGAVCQTVAEEYHPGMMGWKRPAGDVALPNGLGALSLEARAGWNALLSKTAKMLVAQRQIPAWEESFQQWRELFPKASMKLHVEAALQIWHGKVARFHLDTLTTTFRRYFSHLLYARLQRLPKSVVNPLSHAVVEVDTNGTILLSSTHHVWELPLGRQGKFDLRGHLYYRPRPGELLKEYIRFSCVRKSGKRIQNKSTVINMNDIVGFVQCRSLPHFMFWMAVRCLDIASTQGLPMSDDLWLIVAACFYV